MRKVPNITCKMRRLLRVRRYQRTTGRRHKLPSKKLLREWVARRIIWEVVTENPI